MMAVQVADLRGHDNPSGEPRVSCTQSRLRGAELAEFKKLVADAALTGSGPVNLGDFKRGLILIYESGLWKALKLPIAKDASF